MWECETHPVDEAHVHNWSLGRHQSIRKNLTWDTESKVFKKDKMSSSNQYFNLYGYAWQLHVMDHLL